MKQILSTIAIAGSLLACGPGNDSDGPHAGAVELRPTETFSWGAQPIEFALPPAGWRREITNQGGLLGANFIKSGSVGEVIEIAEYMALDDRDRCEELQEILATFEDLDTRDFSSAIRRARLYASPPLNRQEQSVAKQANDTLDRARAAFIRNERDEALRELEVAARQAGRVHYTLDDVIDRVLYKGKGLPPYIKVEVGDPERAEFLGKPAVRQSYTLKESGRTYAGRRLFFMHDNHLFVAGFQGLDENIPLFEQVLETVRFPARDCRL